MSKMSIRTKIKGDVMDFINSKGMNSPAIITGFNRFGCCAVSVNAEVVEEEELKHMGREHLIKIEDKISIYVPEYVANKFKSLSFKLFKTKYSTNILVEEE